MEGVELSTTSCFFFGNGKCRSADDILPFYVSSQAIKDLHLLVIVAGLLAVDVLFLSCWIVIDPLQTEILPFKDMVRNTHSSLLTLKMSARSPFESKNVSN